MRDFQPLLFRQPILTAIVKSWFGGAYETMSKCGPGPIDRTVYGRFAGDQEWSPTPYQEHTPAAKLMMIAAVAESVERLAKALRGASGTCQYE
jgi:hypothetical protein